LLWITAAAFALLVTVIVLYVGVGYLNMTAFEMGAAAIVYIWLLLFIRTVSAAAEGTAEPADDAATPRGGADRDATPGPGGDDAVMNSSAPDAPTASVPLPDGVALVTSHGVDALRVDTAAATADVLLDGAHLVSWTPAGQTDLLWLSPDSRFGAGEAARGGIP